MRRVNVCICLRNLHFIVPNGRWSPWYTQQNPPKRNPNVFELTARKKFIFAFSPSLLFLLCHHHLLQTRYLRVNLVTSSSTRFCSFLAWAIDPISAFESWNNHNKLKQHLLCSAQLFPPLANWCQTRITRSHMDMRTFRSAHSDALWMIWYGSKCEMEFLKANKCRGTSACRQLITEQTKVVN